MKLSLCNSLSSNNLNRVMFKNEKSLLFDGTDDYVDLGDNFNFTTDFSISAWINPEIPSLNYGCIIAKYGPNNLGWDIMLHSSGKLRTTIRGSSNIDTVNVGSVTFNIWTNVVITCSNSQILTYINGILVNTKTGTWTSLTSPESAKIGWRGGTTRFKGNIDEVGVYNSILSSSEITKLYNSGVPFNLLANNGDYTSSSELVSYYRMGDGDTFPTITDHKGSNDGTMTNMSSSDIVADVP